MPARDPMMTDLPLSSSTGMKPLASPVTWIWIGVAHFKFLDSTNSNYPGTGAANVAQVAALRAVPACFVFLTPPRHRVCSPMSYGQPILPAPLKLMIFSRTGGRFLVWLLGVGVAFHGATAAPPGAFTLRIAVDQFGYAPDMTKVAVISDPQLGFNAAESYTPGATLEVRTWGSNTVVFSGARVAWNGGSTNAQSGDKAWWFDFSAVTRWGEYYIYDPANDTRSARFRIDHRVYEEVLKQAIRVFYYQRRGAAKSLPYADARWTDGTNFLGPLQDSQCRLITSPGAGNQKDLRGGWFDAGDYNKYVNWTVNPISDMLFA